MNERSERAMVQYRLFRHLSSDPYWDAPYGVIETTKQLERGAVRLITFGVARYLDATLYVWSPTRIVIHGDGPLADQIVGEYDSEGAVMAALYSLSQWEPDDGPRWRENPANRDC